VTAQRCRWCATNQWVEFWLLVVLNGWVQAAYLCRLLRTPLEQGRQCLLQLPAIFPADADSIVSTWNQDAWHSKSAWVGKGLLAESTWRCSPPATPQLLLRPAWCCCLDVRAAGVLQQHISGTNHQESSLDALKSTYSLHHRTTSLNAWTGFNSSTIVKRCLVLSKGRIQYKHSIIIRCTLNGPRNQGQPGTESPTRQCKQ
jgi:hypothetical protein